MDINFKGLTIEPGSGVQIVGKLKAAADVKVTVEAGVLTIDGTFEANEVDSITITDVPVTPPAPPVVDPNNPV